MVGGDRRGPAAADRTCRGRCSRRRRSAAEMPGDRTTPRRSPRALECGANVRPEGIEVPPGPRHAHDRHDETASADHRLQGGDDLLPGQVAGDAEDHDRIGRRGTGNAPVGHLLPHRWIQLATRALGAPLHLGERGEEAERQLETVGRHHRLVGKDLRSRRPRRCGPRSSRAPADTARVRRAGRG